MTILNTPNDGLHPELIVLFRTVAFLGEVDSEELIGICSSGVENENVKRLKASLNRWTQLGLFEDGGDKRIKLNERFMKGKKETIDSFTTMLPVFCRDLVFQNNNAYPLSGDASGLSSDFVSAISWLLAQNIYEIPTRWEDVENILRKQKVSHIVQNDIRWNSLRYWARYLGFATGDSGSFMVDPTEAIRQNLPIIFRDKNELPAKDFLRLVGDKIPVMDYGVYRSEIEKLMDKSVWRNLDDGNISMSLSLAIRRLEMNSTIVLNSKADSGSSFSLTGVGYRVWSRFGSVVWNGGGK